MKMKKAVKIVTLVLFIISLLYYVGWLIFAVYSAFEGIDSGWAMPAMSNGSKDYGILAFFSAVMMGVLYTVTVVPFVPIYQVIYIIVNIVSAAKRKKQPPSEIPNERK